MSKLRLLALILSIIFVLVSVTGIYVFSSDTASKYSLTQTALTSASDIGAML